MTTPAETHLHVDGDGRALAAATLSAYFHGAAPALFDDPVCGAELRRIAAEDPDVLAAVVDVDRSPIRNAPERSPSERLRCAVNNWIEIAKLRRAG